ncbi:MAG: sigma-54-dependent Fis family transcriptional regulator [Spirochaetales bacterium]|nr:sigma-54-dependent Fis family transcriptional regulator [Spirochaetales bacterium]
MLIILYFDSNSVKKYLTNTHKAIYPLKTQSIKTFSVKTLKRHKAILLNPQNSELINITEFIDQTTFSSIIITSEKCDKTTSHREEITRRVQFRKINPFTFFSEVKSILKDHNSWLDKIFIGQSYQATQVKKKIITAAQSEKNTLLLGATGSGKNLAAFCLHALSERKNKNFLQYNICQSSETFINSELFGSIKGSFTDAVEQEGFIRKAKGGTLLIDEIGETNISSQNKLLDFCETKSVHVMGSDIKQHVNTRIIASTNKDIEKMTKTKEFKLDLFSRISEIKIKIPSLNERRSDLIDFVNILAFRNRIYRRFTDNEVNSLLSRNWIGNIRQLKNYILKLGCKN